IYAKTLFSCITKTDGFDIEISSSNSNGYDDKSKRAIIINLHMDKKPKNILIGTSKVSFQKQNKFKEEVANSSGNTWTWDEDKGICQIKLLKDAEKVNVVVKN